MKTAPISVLFISNDPTLFNPESAVRSRLRSYAAGLGSLTVLSRGPGGDVQEGNLRLCAIPGSAPMALIRLAAKARALVGAGGIDVVSAQDPFEYGWIARHAVRGTRAALHIQVHTDFLSPEFVRGVRGRMRILNWVRCHIAAQILRSAAGIRVVSQRIADRIRTAYPEVAPIAVIPIAVDAHVPTPVSGPPATKEESFVFLAVGRLEPEKRFGDIIDAFAGIAAKYPRATLHLVGEGRERRRLTRRIRAHGLSARIMLLGARSDVRTLMGRAHAFVQASAFEGYGLTLVEAALARLPIITTNVGVVGELLRPDDDVLVVPNSDVGRLSAALETVLVDVSGRQQRSMNAEARVRAALPTQEDTVTAVTADLVRVAGASGRVY